MNYKKILVIFLILLGNASLTHALNPLKDHQYNPDSLGLNIKWTERIIINEDKSEVCVWRLFPDESKKKNITIILSYGDSNNMSHWLLPAVSLLKEGYDIYMYDYRGYGKSGYIYIEPLALYYDEFLYDLKAVVKLAREEHPKNKIGLLSFSMGTIISNIYLQDNKVDFAIYDSYIHNPVTVSNKVYDDKKVLLEIPPSAYNYELKSKNIKTPMLLFLGTNDSFSLPYHVKAFASQRKNRELCEYEGGHLEAFKTLSKNGIGDVFVTRINQFISTL